MMLEFARIFAGMSMIALILAISAALTPQGRLPIRRLDGALAYDGRSLNLAAWLLMAAVGLSGLAALLAISWFAF